MPILRLYGGHRLPCPPAAAQERRAGLLLLGRAPGVCSAPSCVEQAYRAVTPEQAREAQAYYDSLRPEPYSEPTALDLLSDAPLTEGELIHIILNELMNETQARVLSAHDVDCFDLVSGNYEGRAAEAVARVFRSWNALLGTRIFIAGENLLAAAPAR